ncbi:MAG: preprotein translocase subunit SecG [Bacillota bacterium]
MVLLEILLVLVAIALIAVIIAQPSKGEGLGSIGGGGQLFFARNKNLERFLERLTAWLAGIFILLAIIINLVGS